jgi:hypothetical protein
VKQIKIGVFVIIKENYTHALKTSANGLKTKKSVPSTTIEIANGKASKR